MNDSFKEAYYVWLLIGKLEEDNISLYVWDIGKPNLKCATK